MPFQFCLTTGIPGAARVQFNQRLHAEGVKLIVSVVAFVPTLVLSLFSLLLFFAQYYNGMFMEKGMTFLNGVTVQYAKELAGTNILINLAVDDIDRAHKRLVSEGVPCSQIPEPLRPLRRSHSFG